MNEMNHKPGNSEVTTTRAEMVRRRLIFRGDPRSPLLAPRGVWLAQGRLIVADTAQNRVFLWHGIPETEQQPADVVLGQSDTDQTGRNAGGEVTAATLLYPSGLWSDGKRLIVADAWNHRVLIWHAWPTRHGQPADVVLGQPDFHSNQPNHRGISHNPEAWTLHWPYGVYSDGTHLWIADTGNRRVLFFPEIPESNATPAEGVIGQPDLHSRDYRPEHAIWPYSVRIGPHGHLAITDTQYYRVLLWHDWTTAFGQTADVLIGQPDLHANGQNQYGWFPKAHTLNWCYDSFFWKEGIWVADTGNSRVLWFEKVPTRHNPPADNLLGQDDFETGSENKNSIFTTETSMYWPFALCIENGLMAIADTGNHRIILNWLVT